MTMKIETKDWGNPDALPPEAKPIFDLMVKHYTEAKNGWSGPHGRHDHTQVGVDKRLFAGAAIARLIANTYGGTFVDWQDTALRLAATPTS